MCDVLPGSSACCTQTSTRQPWLDTPQWWWWWWWQLSHGQQAGRPCAGKISLRGPPPVLHVRRPACLSRWARAVSPFSLSVCLLCAPSLHRADGTLPAFLGLHNPRVGFARGSSSSRLKTHGALVGGTPRDFPPPLSLSPEELWKWEEMMLLSLALIDLNWDFDSSQDMSGEVYLLGVPYARSSQCEESAPGEDATTFTTQEDYDCVMDEITN